MKKKQEKTEERRRKNLSCLPEYSGYIFNQHAPRYKDLSFGEKGNVGANGCAAVAIQNVMKYIGNEQNFCDVLHDMEELNMTWLGGYFGTKPWTLGKYFTKKNIRYKKYGSPNDFKAALLTNAVGIICTWNERFYGMHFYCIYYSAEEKSYFTANFSSGSRFRPTQLNEISNLRFVVGYTIYSSE